MIPTVILSHTGYCNIFLPTVPSTGDAHEQLGFCSLHVIQEQVFSLVVRIQVRTPTPHSRCMDLRLANATLGGSDDGLSN